MIRFEQTTGNHACFNTSRQPVIERDCRLPMRRVPGGDTRRWRATRARSAAARGAAIAAAAAAVRSVCRISFVRIGNSRTEVVVRVVELHGSKRKVLLVSCRRRFVGCRIDHKGRFVFDRDVKECVTSKIRRRILFQGRAWSSCGDNTLDASTFVFVR